MTLKHGLKKLDTVSCPLATIQINFDNSKNKMGKKRINLKKHVTFYLFFIVITAEMKHHYTLN